MMHPVILFFALGPLFYLLSSLWESVFHEYILDVRPFGRVARFEKTRWRRSWWLGAFEHGAVHHYLTYTHSYTKQFQTPEDEQKLLHMLKRRLSARELRSMQACAYGASITWFGGRYMLLPVYLHLLWLFAADTPGSVAAVILADLMFGLPYFLFSQYVHPYLHLRYADAMEQAPWTIRRFMGTRYGLAMRVLHFVHHRNPTRNFSLQIGADQLRGRWQPPSEQDWATMLALGLITTKHRQSLQQRPFLWHSFSCHAPSLQA